MGDTLHEEPGKLVPPTVPANASTTAAATSTAAAAAVSLPSATTSSASNRGFLANGDDDDHREDKAPEDADAVLQRRDAAFAAFKDAPIKGAPGIFPESTEGFSHVDIIRASTSSDAVCYENQDKQPGTPKVALAPRKGLTARAWLKATAQRCTCVITSIILAA